MATTTAPELPTLNNDEVLRYSRHLIMPEVGMEGQQKLKAARVLCIGTGGLGSPLALYLGAAGVGTLGLVDFDVVDFTNLQRQVIHFTSDVGKPKLESARQKLAEINPFVNVKTFSHQADQRRMRSRSLPTSTSLWMARTISPHAFWSTTRASSPANPTSMDPFSALKARPACSAPKMARATAACIRNRHRRVWYRLARKAACWEFCPGLVGLIQATETIKLILGIGKSAGRAPAAGGRAGHEVPRIEAAQEPRLRGLRNPPHGD